MPEPLHKEHTVMRRRTASLLTVAWSLGFVVVTRADEPASRHVPLSPISTVSLNADSNGVRVQFEIWNQATAGAMVFSEMHTVDMDDGSTISNDTGFADLLLGR
jgi:hypothetical protein